MPIKEVCMIEIGSFFLVGCDSGHVLGFMVGGMFKGFRRGLQRRGL